MSVVYDQNTDKFSLVNKDWEEYIPSAYETIKTFETKSQFNDKMILVFFKYTGLYGAQLSRKNPSPGSSTSFFMWFKNDITLHQCIDYSLNSNFTIIDNDIGDNETHYSFDSGKLQDRIHRWHEGEWKYFNDLGIKSDSSYQEEWTMGSIMHDDEYQLTNYNEFIESVNKFREKEFTCDECNKESVYSDFMHCLDCIKWYIDGNESYKYPIESAYNECYTCHKKTTHNHQLLPHSNTTIMEKYIKMNDDVKKWYCDQEKEHQRDYDIRKTHEEDKLNELKVILKDNPNYNQIIDFVANRLESKTSEENCLVCKDPKIVFHISSIFTSMLIFTDADEYKKWFNRNTNAYSCTLVYLSTLDSIISPELINISNRKHITIITSIDYIPSAIDFQCGVETWNRDWQKSDVYCMMIDFNHTGTSGLAIKYYDKATPENIITDIFWFESDDLEKECRRYLQKLISFDYNNGTIGYSELKTLLHETPYKQILIDSEKGWYDGLFDNGIIKKELPFSTVDDFKNKIKYIKPNIIQQNYTVG